MFIILVRIYHPQQQRMLKPGYDHAQISYNLKIKAARAYDASSKQLRIQKSLMQWADILEFWDWTNVRTLKINDCNLTDTSIKLLESNHWPNMKQLSLACNAISQQGVYHLLNSIMVSNVSNLNLSHNRIRGHLPETKKGIAEDINLLDDDCDEMNINLSDLTVTIVDWNCSKMRMLSVLNLNYNKLGSNGAKLVAKLNIPNLTELSLISCMIGDSGAKSLTKGKWPPLHQLNLQGNKIEYDGLQHYRILQVYLELQEQTGLEKLLYLYDSNYSKAIYYRYNKYFIFLNNTF